MPAVVIPHLGNRLRLGFHEPDAEALAQRGLHRVHTEPPQGVFPARLAPVLALAVLLLQDRDRAHGIHHLLARHPAEVKPKKLLGFRPVMGGAEPTAGVKVVVLGERAVHHGQETDVLREEINRVVARVSDPDLEFAGQVMRAVDRFFYVERRDSASFVIGQENLGVGGAARREFPCDRVRQAARIQRKIGVEVVEFPTSGLHLH